MKDIYLEDLIAKPFHHLIDKVLDNQIYELICKGGRGSTKSSFAAEIIIYGMMEDYYTKGLITHCVAMRKVKNTLSGTVYNKFLWALKQLGVEKDWHCIKSPMEMTFKPSGQKIVFHGCDEPTKIKSMSFDSGFVKYGWWEEFDQYEGMEEIRNVNQSIFRGGEAICIMTFNPPPIASHWVNEEAAIEKRGRIVHHSSYLDVDPEWLGATFIQMAEDLKEQDLRAYENEYLGIITGIGGEIFKNVKEITLTDEEIFMFEYTRQAVDFGFTVDPTAYNKLCYKQNQKSIWTFDEFHEYGMGTASLCKKLNKRLRPWEIIKCDGQEPRTVNTMVTEYDTNAVCCKKGPDSVRHGIEWLADLNAIYIDRKRCPRTYQEIVSYTFDKDKNGNWIKQYPDKNNHHIDAHRYALDDIILQSGWRIPK